MKKECPFCGNKLVGIGWGNNKLDGDFCHVKCRICQSSGPRAETEEKAWYLWDSRVHKENK